MGITKPRKKGRKGVNGKYLQFTDRFGEGDGLGAPRIGIQAPVQRLFGHKEEGSKWRKKKRT